MIHYGTLGAHKTACGIDLLSMDIDDPRGARTIQSSNVTCQKCVRVLEINAIAFRYRYDPVLCKAVLAQHASRNGRRLEWL